MPVSQAADVAEIDEHRTFKATHVGSLFYTQRVSSRPTKLYTATTAARRRSSSKKVITLVARRVKATLLKCVTPSTYEKLRRKAQRRDMRF